MATVGSTAGHTKRRNERAGRHHHEGERGGCDECGRIPRAHARQQRFHDLAGGEPAKHTENDAYGGKPETSLEHEPEDVAGPGAQREPDPDFTDACRHEVRQQTVNAHGREARPAREPNRTPSCVRRDAVSA